MGKRKRVKTWSYIAGRKGVNRVRAFEMATGGDLYLEWHEPVLDGGGKPVCEPATGHVRKERRRKSLAAEGMTSYAQAVVKAEEMAELVAGFAEVRQASPAALMVATTPAPAVDPEEEDAGPLTLGRLLELYLKEVSPTTDPDTQRGHRIAARMFLAFFGPGAVVERIGRNGRPKTDLGRVRFNAWVEARRTGAIPGFPQKCRPQTVLSNFRFLRAVFRWGRTERDDGSILLVRNPWEGFSVPPEDNPVRSEMTRELHDTLAAAAPNWRMAVVMELCRETRRRMNSVRNLKLTDMDLEARRVTWRAAYDKTRKTTTTPLSSASVAAIRRAMEHRLAEGVSISPWLFPAPSNPAVPVPETTLHSWMRATRKRCGITVPRLGYHGEKRAGIRDPLWKLIPVEVREALSGTTFETQKRVYGYVALPEMEEALSILEGGSPPPLRPEPRTELPMAA